MQRSEATASASRQSLVDMSVRKPGEVGMPAPLDLSSAHHDAAALIRTSATSVTTAASSPATPAT